MPPSGAYTLDQIDPHSSLAEEWNDLVLRCEDGSYFQTPEWILAWWSTTARQPPTNLYLWRTDAGALAAVVVVSEIRERLHPRLAVSVRALANAGSGSGGADHCAWAVTPEAVADVRSFLDALTMNRSLLVRSLPANTECPWLPGRAVPIAETVCPRVDLTSLEPGTSTKLQSQLRQYKKRLRAEGVDFRYVGPSEMDSSLLRTLLDLHERRRGMKNEGTAFGRDKFGLHERLILSSRPGFGPAAFTAVKDGRVVGVLYGFWWGETFTYFQSGWDPAWSRFSLGTVLVGEALDGAKSSGATTFDLLRGQEPYKYRFGARDSRERTWLVPRGPGGKVLQLKYLLKRG